MSTRKMVAILTLGALSLAACSTNVALKEPGAAPGGREVTLADAGWSAQQQVFTLSMLSNKAAGQQGTPQVLQQYLATQINGALGNQGLQSLIGTWKIAWGPVVYQAPDSQVADNAMYVANSGNAYIVAIAGTNSLSLYDLQTEDMNVADPVAWPWGGVPGGLSPMIAPGTQDGVNALLAMVDPASSLTLQAFLQKVATGPGNPSVVFTGHSLGGALAPTLALALFNGSGPLRPTDWLNLLTYPTAGPTPGNADFVTFYSRVFPNIRSGLQSWNSLVWNSLDVVPHAWNTTTLSAFPTLYGTQLPPSLCVQGIAAFMNAEVSTDGYSQVSPVNNQGSLAGSYQQSLPAGYPVPSGTYATTTQFAEQAFYQHIEGYYDLLGVDQLLPPSQSNPNGLGIVNVPLPPAGINTLMTAVCSQGNGSQTARSR